MKKKLSQTISEKIHKVLELQDEVTHSPHSFAIFLRFLLEDSSVDNVCDLKKMNRKLDAHIKFGEEFKKLDFDKIGKEVNKLIKKDPKKFYKKAS